MRVVLLPGMDGTGELFARFVAAAPEDVRTQVVSFPRDEPLGYAALAERVRCVLPNDAPWVLLGESFSGPLALRLAADRPPGLRGVVLVATFVRAPVTARWAAPVAPFLSRARPPRWLLARYLTGGNADVAADVRAALATVSPRVITERLRAIAGVDARTAIRACAAPLLALHATHDRLLGRRAPEEMRRLRPDAAMAAIDATHLVLQAAPIAAWDAIQRSIG